MTIRVMWTATALRRVEEIGDHIAEERPSAAAKLVSRLFDAVERAAEFPRSAPMYGLANTETIRQLAVPPYLVYYKILDSDKSIAVLTVRHQRQRRAPIEDETDHEG